MKPLALELPSLPGSEIVDAIYTPATSRDLHGNPLIEALPAFDLSKESILTAFTRDPYFARDERLASTAERTLAISRLDDYLQALPFHCRLCQDILNLVQSGYRHRRPLDPSYCKEINERYRQSKLPGLQPLSDAFSPKADALTFIGISGVGKSSAIDRSLSFLPKAIRHREIGVLQIPYIKIDCPSSGSLRQMSLRILHHVDRLLKTPYQELCRNSAADVLSCQVARILEYHYTGVLVIDEFQNLVHSHEGKAKVLGFLISLANEMKVPIILVGTPLAEEIMTRAFAVARRVGAVNFLKPLADETWGVFCEATWRYQWVHRTSKLSDEIVEAWFEETQGVPALAILLFRFCQVEAIRSGLERVTPKSLKRVADEYFGSVRPMINALKSNRPEELKRFDDLFSRNLRTLRKIANDSR
jgi:hypothetical protein